MENVPLYPVRQAVKPIPSELEIPSTPIPPPQINGIGYGKGDPSPDRFFTPPGEEDAEAYTVTSGQLYRARRFPFYHPDKTEDDFAHGQSLLDKAANGVTKGLLLTGTTFVQSTLGLLYGGAEWARTGKFSSFFNNDLTQFLDKTIKESENYLPNYYTDEEKDARWYSPTKLFTANFLFDAIVKNLGFAAGAALSGGVYSAAIKGLLNSMVSAFPKLAKMISVGKGAEALAATESKLFSPERVAEVLGKIDIEYKKYLSGYDYLNKGRRAVVSGVVAAGESSIESLGALNEFRDGLIENYKEEHGVAPKGEDLEKINQLSEDVGTSVFVANMFLLSATNYIQLPKILGSSFKAETGVINDVVSKIDDITMKDGKYIPLPKIKNKTLRTLNNIRGYTFSSTESFEEGMQFASSAGVQDYHNKKYKGEAATYIGSFIEGIKETVTTDEGMQNVLIGGLSGAIMLGPGRYKERSRLEKATLRATELFTKHAISDFTKDTMDAVDRGTALQQEREDELRRGDVLMSKDLEADYIINYLSPRMKYGRYDLVREDLKLHKDLASSDEGWQQLIAEGKVLPTDDRAAYLKRIDNLSSIADNIKTLYQKLNLRFSGEILKDKDDNPIVDSRGKPILKYPPSVIDKMIYALSKIEDYERRIPQLKREIADELSNAGEIIRDINGNPIIDDRGRVSRNPIDLDAIINDIYNGKIGSFTEAERLINESQIVDKEEIKEKLDDLGVLVLKRLQFANEFETIKKDPLYSAEEDVVAAKKELGKTVEVDVEGKEGETKSVKIGKEYSLSDTLHWDDRSGTLNLLPKLTVLSKSFGDEYRVKLPDGSVKFMSKKELSKYKMTEESLDDIKQDLEKQLNDVVDEVMSRKEFEEFGKPPTTNKIAFVNSIRNKKLSDAVAKEFNAKVDEIHKKRLEERKQREATKANKENIDKEQSKFEDKEDAAPIAPNEGGGKHAGDVGDYNITGEDFKKPRAADLGRKTTTESEDWDDPTQSAPHVERARRFLNRYRKFSRKKKRSLRAMEVTVHQVDRAGLNGLVEMSYEKNKMDRVTDPYYGFVAAVIVEYDEKKEKYYFVDEKGERIGEYGTPLGANINKVVFQTRPTPDMYYEGLKNKKQEAVPRFRKEEKEKAQIELNKWRKKREMLFSSPDANPIAYKFHLSKGIGKRQRNDKNNMVRHHVSEGIVTEEIIGTERIIDISTKDEMPYNGRMIKPNQPGLTVLNFDNVFEILALSGIAKEQAITLYYIIEDIAKSVAKNKQMNESYSEFLSNVLFWKNRDKTSNNSFYIDADASQIVLGNKRFDIPTIENSKDAIIEYLSNPSNNVFHSVNKKTLDKKFNQKFIEIVAVQDGSGGYKLEQRVWKNYQTYLLSSKYPDGSKRDVKNTPLSTTLDPVIEQEEAMLKQIYMVLEEYELPEIAGEKVEKKEEQPQEKGEKTIGEYNIEGKENTFKTNKYGDVKFTAVEDTDGKIIVSVTDVEKLGDIIDVKTDEVKDAEAYNIIDNFIKTKYKELENVSKKEKIEFILSITINTKLSQLKEQEQQAAEEGEEAEPQAPTDETREEEPPAPEQKVVKKSTLRSDSRGEEPLRAVGFGEKKKERITERDLEIFKEWAKDNVPGIPYEILERIFIAKNNTLAWGVFQDDVAKFYRGAIKGTEYHEVFEAIWNTFLTPEEQTMILEDERSKSGTFVDRQSGKKFRYDDAVVTDDMLKERIADDFAEFRLGKIPAISLTDKIIRFFRNIINFVTSKLFKERTLKDKLFEQIEAGRFKESKMSTPYMREDVHEIFKDKELANSIYKALGLIYTNEDDVICAMAGAREHSFTRGSRWEIVKDLKGYPSHAQGGVDIKLGKDGFSFSKGEGEVKAAHGLVLPKIK